MSGSAVAVAGSPLGRGSARPSRPRAEAFAPGQLPADRPPAARVQPPFRPDAAADFPGRLDVVFYAKPRPLRVQVAVRTGGTPLAKRWEDHLKKLFAAFDRDGDGFLNRYELEYVFPPDGMRLMFQGGLYYSRAAGPPPLLNVIDRDGDGRVSFSEFAYHNRELLPDLIRSRPLPDQAGDNTLTRELFNRLDRDKDGKLSEPELRAAETTLLTLDGDEDECVSSQELLANSSQSTPTVRAAKVIRPTSPAGSPAAIDAQTLGVFHGGVPEAVVKQIIKRYDRDGDAALTRAEVGFPAALFDRLDRDGDGTLSAAELDGWRTGPPDAVVALELGDKPEACKVSARPPEGREWPAGMTVRQTVPGRLVLRVMAQTVEFTATAPPPDFRRRTTQEGVAANFPQGKLSATDADLVGPQFQFLRVVFDAADFDGNGVLTRAEFDRYFALQRGTTEIALTLSYAVRTPNLFQMLDDNKDGRLGVRELRTAWDRMVVLEPPGSTAVTKAILQPSGSLRLSSAAYAFSDPTASRDTTAARRKGPLWFRKMDRNADGDVSRGEFLGDAVAFARLDADGDGLIALEEAEAYEQKVRPAKNAKKE
ncbi:MAG TPA: EF-hand domain-containing protein [Fimbriiglobus sp.]|nr:EF-hand domain-containing protein [Fimbriiglobus sp.]